MHTWILIMTLMMVPYGGGALSSSVTAVEFNSRQSCLDAANLWLKTAGLSYTRVKAKAQCTPK